jgi:hypothetical protein
MTVASETSRQRFSGNEVKTEFNYTYTLYDPGDLKVMHVDADGAESLLQPFEYSISYEGDPPYQLCMVTYPLAGDPMGYNEQLILFRDSPKVQETDLTNQQAYFLESLERQLDRNVLMIQELADQVKRAPVLSESTPPWQETILGVPQPGYFLRWSDDPNDNILDSVDIALDIIDQILGDESMQDLITASFDTPEYNIAFVREWDVHVAADNVQIDRGWILTGTDWDTLVDPGFYRYDGTIYTGQTNMPAATIDYGLLSVEVSGGYIRQFYSEAPPAEASTYMRTCINSVWSVWGMALAIPPGGGGSTIAGLDADMVDGQHCLPETMPAEGLLKVGDYGVTHTVLDVNICYTDMNELIHSGTFYISTGTNAPFNEDWAVEVTRYDDNWLRQTAYNFWYPEEIYVRTCDQYNGWSDWCFILTDTNIGWVDIDADTVDGKHAEDHPMPQEGLIQVGTYGVTYQALDITGFDWDTMTVSGVWQDSNSVTPSPRINDQIV